MISLEETSLYGYKRAFKVLKDGLDQGTVAQHCNKCGWSALKNGHALQVPQPKTKSQAVQTVIEGENR